MNVADMELLRKCLDIIDDWKDFGDIFITSNEDADWFDLEEYLNGECEKDVEMAHKDGIYGNVYDYEDFDGWYRNTDNIEWDVIYDEIYDLVQYCLSDSNYWINSFVVLFEEYYDIQITDEIAKACSEYFAKNYSEQISVEFKERIYDFIYDFVGDAEDYIERFGNYEYEPDYDPYDDYY